LGSGPSERAHPNRGDRRWRRPTVKPFFFDIRGGMNHSRDEGTSMKRDLRACVPAGKL